MDNLVHVEMVRKRATCTPTSLGDSQQDDTPAIKAAIQACGNGGTIIPPGKTYSLRSMLDLSGCVNCDIQLEGTLKSSTDYTFWSKQRAIILAKNISGLTFRSLTGTGVIDGNGQSSYEAYAVSPFARPTVFYIQGGRDITVSGFKIRNPPNVFFNQRDGVTNIKYSNLNLSAVSKSSVQPKNTDGFDIGESMYTTISDITIENQDDCIAIKSGANYVEINTITCAGEPYQNAEFRIKPKSIYQFTMLPGTNHGLIIGSLGKTNADFAKNIFIEDITMINCGKAAGIKVYEGGSGRGTSTVTNVTWDGVTVDGCDYGASLAGTSKLHPAPRRFCATVLTIRIQVSHASLVPLAKQGMSLKTLFLGLGGWKDWKEVAGWRKCYMYVTNPHYLVAEHWPETDQLQIRAGAGVARF